MKFTPKIWFFVIVVGLSFLSLFVSLNPVGLTFLQKGVLVSSVDSTSVLYEDGVRQGMIIIAINGNKINNLSDFYENIHPYLLLDENETIRAEITVKGVKNSIIGLYGKDSFKDINVKNIPSSKLKTGLDLQGGARAFVRVNGSVSSSDLDDVIAVLEERLNVYGLSDMRLYKVDADTEQLVGIEIAGSSPEQLESLIEEQGHFEAKIGNYSVFIGGDKDVTHVARTGENAGIYECRDSEGGAYCSFRFTITLSVVAADKFAEATKDLDVEGDYLSENITFYIDGIETSALRISSGLKGSPQTTISISGSDVGEDKQSAYDGAELEMKKLQTILITGSLPYELEIVKIDRISPNVGEDFTKRILLAGIFAFLGVMLFTFFKYRKIKVSIALVLVSFAEILITLGIASLINWNLDLASIAGIIAAIGTGIDSEIVILDESRVKGESLKEQIKKALFIITTSFATTFVALLPLTGILGFLGIGAASAGLLKGFAFTTIIGITIGVLISRPAFSDIAEQLKAGD